MGARGTSARVFFRVWLRMESAIWEAWSSRRRRSSETKSDRRTRSSAMVGGDGGAGGSGDGEGRYVWGGRGVRRCCETDGVKMNASNFLEERQYINGQPINGICSIESFSIRYYSVLFGIVRCVANEEIFRDLECRCICRRSLSLLMQSKDRPNHIFSV